jgi:hypothetical protein
MVASELAGANVPVIFEVDMQPNSGGRDLGRGDDVIWPRYDVCAKLVEKGVTVAITPSLQMSPRNIRYASARLSRHHPRVPPGRPHFHFRLQPGRRHCTPPGENDR